MLDGSPIPAEMLQPLQRVMALEAQRAAQRGAQNQCATRWCRPAPKHFESKPALNAGFVQPGWMASRTKNIRLSS